MVAKADVSAWRCWLTRALAVEFVCVRRRLPVGSETVSVAKLTESFVIAVDAGGTHTRVGCFGLDGSLLSTGKGRGGSPNHNHDAAQNVSTALIEALRAANLNPADAVGLAAGMAGISRRGSNQGTGLNEWADAYYALPSLNCPRTIVNDAVIAHRGALVGEAGVIVVAGTGSMILGITDEGVEVESGQFEHYAGGARHLVFDVMHRILIGAVDAADAELVAKVLEYWQAADVSDLRRIILRMGSADRNDMKRRYGGLAPAVTAAADTSPLADAALRSLTDKTAYGVLMLAPLMRTTPVSVAVTGALASHPAFTNRLNDSLTISGTTPTNIVAPTLNPLGGAAILAYGLAGLTAEADVVDRLATATSARFPAPN